MAQRMLPKKNEENEKEMLEMKSSSKDFSSYNIYFHLLDLHISSPQVRGALNDIILNLPSPISLSFWFNWFFKTNYDFLIL